MVRGECHALVSPLVEATNSKLNAPVSHPEENVAVVRQLPDRQPEHLNILQCAVPARSRVATGVWVEGSVGKGECG
jgi:hypothetical protein